MDRREFVAAALALSAGAKPASAQDLPRSKPLTVIVRFANSSRGQP